MANLLTTELLSISLADFDQPLGWELADGPSLHTVLVVKNTKETFVIMEKLVSVNIVGLVCLFSVSVSNMHYAVVVINLG